VSSLRDLEFARAAGTIAPGDYTRLRRMLERSAYVRHADERVGRAPIRTVLAAALVVAVVAAVAAVTLPREAGDRAPGAPITGTPPTLDVATLEARAQASPNDVPTQLALADGYVRAGRSGDAAKVYQSVLTRDPNNIAALDGLALILVASGVNDGALLAADRVLAQRSRDADALFVKGLALYNKGEWKAAVDVWNVYLDVGAYHEGADTVRVLIQDARTKAGR
jgi:cytochrome c-type biogenesis protein CcmH/NrfG